MSIELQSRKAERKRRRTANHQFVYSNWELSTKRKRYSYLQSAGKAPQTRQSAARSIGPSPTPQQSGKILANKSLPPSTKNSSSSKTLISTQKVIAKPNILRNGVENKTVTKNGNENNAQSQNNKALGSKVVHIPGLPSSLTIERIEADSAICISCRNPGTLTICQQCSSKYHISCHTVSPPPPKICPACALNLKDSPSFTGVICKKENELATAAYTTRGIRKTGEDPKVNKTTRGFHKIDATTKRNIVPTNFGINQLPSSTYLIPISTSAMSLTNHPTIKNPTQINRTDTSEIRFIDQFTHSGNITFINNKNKFDLSNYSTHQESSTSSNTDQQQSYYVVKKIPEPTNYNGGGGARGGRRQNNGKVGNQNNPILNYQLSSPCGYSTTHGQPEMPLTQSSNSIISNKVVGGRRTEPSSNASSSRKSNNTRSLPGLNRIYVSNNRQHGFDSSSSDEDNSHDKNVSGFGNLLNPLFSVNNKSNIIASGSSESQRDTTDRTDHANFWQYSQIQNAKFYDRTDEPANNTEHVKLEEAHISAPSRTKLNSDITENVKKLNPVELSDKLNNTKTYERKIKILETRMNNTTSDVNDKTNVIQSVMEVTLDDDDDDDDEEIVDNVNDNNDHESESPQESKKETDKIEEKEEIISNSLIEQQSDQESDNLQTLYALIKGTLDFIIAERKHTSNEIGGLEKSASKQSCIEQDDSIEILNEDISISDEKADSENQDLFSDNSRPLIIDEGNNPVEKINNYDQSNVSNLEIKETIVIDSVSSDKIELLEQFESAILNINQDIND